MGCDIHLFGEKKVTKKWYRFWKKSLWVSVDKYTPNPDYGSDPYEPKLKIAYADRIYTGGRSYNIFCALAGVRSWHFSDSPRIISEPKGMPNDCCPEIKEECKRWGSDGHSHSWLTLRELQEFDWSEYGTTCDKFREEVIPKLQKHSKNPENVRIVFWFDN